MQFTLRLKKTNRKKNIPTTNPCLPKDISFEWISVTAPSNKASLPVKRNDHKKFSPTSSHFATRRLQLETWMWLTKRMHQKAWCVLEVRSHIPQTLHHQQRFRNLPVGMADSLNAPAMKQSIYHQWPPIKAKRLKLILYVDIMFAFVSLDVFFFFVTSQFWPPFLVLAEGTGCLKGTIPSETPLLRPKSRVVLSSFWINGSRSRKIWRAKDPPRKRLKLTTPMCAVAVNIWF